MLDPLRSEPALIDQVYDRLVEAISDGSFLDAVLDGNASLATHLARKHAHDAGHKTRQRINQMSQN